MSCHHLVEADHVVLCELAAFQGIGELLPELERRCGFCKMIIELAVPELDRWDGVQVEVVTKKDLRTAGPDVVAVPGVGRKVLLELHVGWQLELTLLRFRYRYVNPCELLSEGLIRNGRERGERTRDRRRWTRRSGRRCGRDHLMGRKEFVGGRHIELHLVVLLRSRRQIRHGKDVSQELGRLRSDE